jgi:hypothetical protein
MEGAPRFSGPSSATFQPFDETQNGEDLLALLFSREPFYLSKLFCNLLFSFVSTIDAHFCSRRMEKRMLRIRCVVIIRKNIKIELSRSNHHIDYNIDNKFSASDPTNGRTISFLYLTAVFFTARRTLRRAQRQMDATPGTNLQAISLIGLRNSRKAY